MDKLIHIFKLMSDETRLRIIILLYQEELCVCQITGITDIAQPKISKALSKLRDLHLVSDRREEKFVYYRLNKANSFFNRMLEDIMSHLEDYPQLVQDQSRIIMKDTFLSSCNTTKLTLK